MLTRIWAPWGRAGLPTEGGRPRGRAAPDVYVASGCKRALVRVDRLTVDDDLFVGGCADLRAGDL